VTSFPFLQRGTFRRIRPHDILETMSSSRRYVDVTTPMEWLFRIGLAVSFLSLLGLLWGPGTTYAAVAISCSVFFTVLCLAWNDQYEISPQEGLVLNRTVFGAEKRKVVCGPESLERVAVRTKRIPVKNATEFVPHWETTYRVTVVTRNGKRIPVGPSFPRIEKNLIVTNWPQARVDANDAGQALAGALGIQFEPTHG
jgi:hypothetical protein